MEPEDPFQRGGFGSQRPVGEEALPEFAAAALERVEGEIAQREQAAAGRAGIGEALDRVARAARDALVDHLAPVGGSDGVADISGKVDHQRLLLMFLSENTTNIGG